METCIIFCAGEFDALAEQIKAGDHMIAADGGVRHVQALGLTPHTILGDFDSLGYIPQGAQVFPVEKDDTDAMLALRRGLELGYRRFVIYGGLDGPRIDHAMANFQALQYLASRGGTGYLVGNTAVATVIENGAVSFPETAVGNVSVFCMGSDARGVDIRGLRYNLTDGTLSAGFPLGVSNHFVGKNAKISVRHGSLLVIFDRENGLPETC